MIIELPLLLGGEFNSKVPGCVWLEERARGEVAEASSPLLSVP